jgi:hypothetical protein
MCDARSHHDKGAKIPLPQKSRMRDIAYAMPACSMPIGVKIWVYLSEMPL